MKRLLLTAFFLLPLSACNRPAQPAFPTDTASSSATAAQPVQPNSGVSDDPRPVLVAFGDSLTAGYGADSDKSYPDYLQKELDARGYRYRVVNEGVSGNTTKDGLSRVDEVVALHPAVAIVAFGGNDGLRGVQPQEMQANLESIVQTLQNAHSRVVIAGITLPPNYGATYIRRFDDVFPSVAKKYNTPLVPFLLLNVWDVPGDMQRDGIHATAPGNAQVARNLLPALEPLLTK
jgi:acyl-CoA thioesterase I